MNTRILMGCLAGALLMLTTGCKTCGKEGKNALPGADDLRVDEAVRFNSDSAYAYAGQQVAFGPRVPGTPGSRACADYIIDNLQRFRADTVTVQTGEVKAFNGDVLPITNIMASFNPGAPRRILLAAHYDTRPWADEDPDPANRSKPIDGANDGASGVGVILELARNIGATNPEIGVDFLLTDLEDYGERDADESTSSSSWALGAQYFARNQIYTPTQRPQYGILLDMVGGKNARFYREYFSERDAQWLNTKVWQAAKTEGIARFIDQRHGAITDDHLFIGQAGIPCIDIIECANEQTGSFPPYWHTMADDMTNIDRQTLSDVGRTLMRVIYSER